MAETGDAQNSRRLSIDWLRVMGILAVFLFHCGRFFNEEDWHVKNSELSFGMTVFVAVVAMWIMPLFFMLSGISTRYALDRKGAGAFLAGRARRLLVPFLFGVFVVIAPLQVWIERVSHGRYSGSFLGFLAGPYFQGWYGINGNFAWMGLHLWYLGMLFVFTVLCLPVFLYLKRISGKRQTVFHGGLWDVSGTVFLGAVPIFLMELLVNLQPQGIGMRSFGGWSPPTYLVFYLMGHVMAGSDVLFLSMARHARIALVLVSSTIFLGYWLHARNMLGFSHGPSVYIMTALLFAVNSWSWMVLLFGFARRRLDFGNAFLGYAVDAVLPFYILHQTVIVGMGFLMAGLPSPVMVKYAMLASSSFILIMAIYELVVRRFTLTRFLFGMKPVRPPGRYA